MSEITPIIEVGLFIFFFEQEKAKNDVNTWIMVVLI